MRLDVAICGLLLLFLLALSIDTVGGRPHRHQHHSQSLTRVDQTEEEGRGDGSWDEEEELEYCLKGKQADLIEISRLWQAKDACEEDLRGSVLPAMEAQRALAIDVQTKTARCYKELFECREHDGDELRLADHQMDDDEAVAGSTPHKQQQRNTFLKPKDFLNRLDKVSLSPGQRNSLSLSLSLSLYIYMYCISSSTPGSPPLVSASS